MDAVESNGELRSKDEMLELEKEFFTRTHRRNSRKDGLEIFNYWAAYIGNDNQELVSLARTHILYLGRWLDRRINFEELKRTLVPSKIERRDFCYPRQKNELMQGTALVDLAIESLKRKYGQIPDSFAGSVNGCGDIEFHRVICKNCRFFNGCDLMERCNCYDAAEFERRQNERSEKLSEIESFIKKYRRNTPHNQI